MFNSIYYSQRRIYQQHFIISRTKSGKCFLKHLSFIFAKFNVETENKFNSKDHEKIIDTTNNLLDEFEKFKQKKINNDELFSNTWNIIWNTCFS